VHPPASAPRTARCAWLRTAHRALCLAAHLLSLELGWRSPLRTDWLVVVLCSRRGLPLPSLCVREDRSGDMTWRVRCIGEGDRLVAAVTADLILLSGRYGAATLACALTQPTPR
jgi:hypothetical protein